MKAFIVAALALTLTTGTVTAQQKEKVETETNKTKIKPTSSIGQKAHNVVRRHHKRHNGMKYKNKNKVTGKKTKEITKDN